MKPSLRKVLTESHVGAVGIAVLLFWSIESAFWALWGLRTPLYRAGEFVVTAVAIRGIPDLSGTLTYQDRFTLFLILMYVFSVLVCLAVAWRLSKWLYGTGPFRSLGNYHAKFARGDRA